MAKKVVEEKENKLNLALSQIEKQFGKGAIMKLGSKKIEKIPVISTGSISLDRELGIGGIPKGRITEIYGPESSGKTTLCLHAIAEAQKAGGVAAFIDAEHALDPIYAKALGVDTDNLLLSQPDSGEQALEIVEALIRSDSVDIIVVDSVAALVPKAEINGEMGDSHMGLQARLMSQAMRKLTGVISKSGTSLVFINQIRHKIGVMFGSPEITTGGNALKFYASVRMDIRRVETIKKGDEAIANLVRVRVLKNKLAPPFKKTEFNIVFGKGIDIVADLLSVATDMGFIEKSGTWYNYGPERIGQGKANAATYLSENPSMLKEVSDKVYAKIDEERMAATETTPKEVVEEEVVEETKEIPRRTADTKTKDK